MLKPIQQGDIIFVPVEKIPETAKPAKPRNNKYILAEGEATGHTHTVEVSPQTKVFWDNNRLYLQNNFSVPVEHQEHKTLIVPTGNWEVRRVKEWDYDEEQAKRIRD